MQRNRTKLPVFLKQILSRTLRSQVNIPIYNFRPYENKAISNF